MADITQVKQGMLEEPVSLYRGFVLMCSMLAGMTIVLILLKNFFQASLPANGVIGYFTLGLKKPFEAYQALAVIAGGVAAVFIGEWLWMILAHVQRLVSPLPVGVTLKRSAVAFSPFLVYGVQLSQGQGLILAPLVTFLLLGLGFFLLALFEKKDKRKIYFAFPTENRYQPISLFPHGSVIALGTGIGWFMQTLPELATTASWGMWFALTVGLIFWIVSINLAALLTLFYRKLTFDQVYMAVAFVCMPLALLPLQVLGGVTYIDHGKIVAANKVEWLEPALLLSTIFSGLVILIIALIKLKKLKVEITISWEEVFKALMLIVPIPLLLYAVAYWPLGAPFSSHHLLGSVDMFQEGESLATARAMLMGRLPFNDILLRHGFIPDAISGLAALNWFGGTLESYRLMLSYLAPLGLIGIYICAIFCMPWLWAMLLGLTLLTGHLGLIPYTRFLFPLIGFIFTLFYFQSNRRYLLILSGVMTAFSVVASYNAGIMALSGQLTLMLVYVFVSREVLAKRLTSLGLYIGSTIVALLPWLLYLGMSGSLNDYFKNFSWITLHYADVFGLPLPGLGKNPGLMELVIFSIPPVVIASGAVISLKAVLDRKDQHQVPWNVLLLTVITGLYWMRFLTRSHFSFLLETLPIAAMLMAFFLFRLTIKQQRLKGVVLVMLLPLLLISQPGKITLKEFADGFGSKTKIVVDGLSKPKSALLGYVFLKAEEAGQIDQMIDYMNEQVGTAETFFDFSNQPLLYFLVPRQPVTKFLSTIGLATFEQQLEAIRQIERNEVKMVIYDGQPVEQAGADHIPYELRQYAVSEYLLAKYIPIKKIGTNVIMLRKEVELKADKDAAEAMKRLVPFYHLPIVMGNDSAYADGQGNRVTQFTASDKSAVEAKGMTVTAEAGSIKVDEGPEMTFLKLSSQNEEAQSANVITLKLKVSPQLDGKVAQLLWGEAKENAGLEFILKGDGEEHAYAFRVGALPSWNLAEKIDQLQLVIPGGGWQWKSANGLKLKDIPELKVARETKIVASDEKKNKDISKK